MCQILIIPLVLLLSQKRMPRITEANNDWELFTQKLLTPEPAALDYGTDLLSVLWPLEAFLWINMNGG